MLKHGNDFKASFFTTFINYYYYYYYNERKIIKINVWVILGLVSVTPSEAQFFPLINLIMLKRGSLFFYYFSLSFPFMI